MAGFTSIMHLRSSVPTKFLLAVSAHAAAWALPYSTIAGSHLGPEKLPRIQLAENCFVVCGGTPCPTTFQAEFVQERCRGARSKEVSPILFVHSRVLSPSRWSL